MCASMYIVVCILYVDMHMENQSFLLYVNIHETRAIEERTLRRVTAGAKASSLEELKVRLLASEQATAGPPEQVLLLGAAQDFWSALSLLSKKSSCSQLNLHGQGYKLPTVLLSIWRFGRWVTVFGLLLKRIDFGQNLAAIGLPRPKR